MKTLTIVSTGLFRSDPKKEAADEFPRASLYEHMMDSDMLDEQFLENAPRWRRWIYKFLPKVPAQVIEAYCICKRYDVVISWSDPHTLLFAALLKLTGRRVPFVALMFWISKPKKAAILKRVYSHIDTIVLWTSADKDFAINTLGIPPTKIRFIPYYVDQKFWRPMPGEGDTISSVGIEMRDYPTLIEAMRGLDIKCHIAVGHARGRFFSTVAAIYNHGPLPANVTVGKLGATELRALYARSRFVVIPLLPSESDNGLTSILEAMAMGKAVICSRTAGQRDVIQDGKTGIFVPQGDPKALRDAINYLFTHPEEARNMGIAGRKHIETHNTWEQFINNIKLFSEELVKKPIESHATPYNSKSARKHATGTSLSS